MRVTLAGHQRQLADQRLDQGRLAGAVGAEQADAVARLQAEAHARENPSLRPVAAFAVVDAQQRVRQPGRRRELDPELALGAHRLGAGQLGQPLHPALRLAGLAGLGLEAVDELLQVRALGLLLLVRDLLLAQVLGALALEGGVVAHVQPGLAVVEMQGVRAHPVEELAVVADQQQGAGILEQPLLQPQHRVQVEVVGGFVEQQQVAGHHQRARQVQAHAPAAGERTYRAVVGLGREAQTVQQPPGAGLGVVTAQFGQLLVGFGHRLPVLAGVGRGLGLDHPGDDVVAAQHELDRRVGQRGGLLRHAGDAHPVGHVDVAAIGLDLAPDSREQAGLAGAVAADHAHAPARVQGQVDIGQEQALAPAEGEVSEGDHGARILPEWLATPAAYAFRA